MPLTFENNEQLPQPLLRGNTQHAFALPSGEDFVYFALREI
jgi:hypothetical protein